YLFMYPSGLDLASNSRGSLQGWVYGVSCTATPPRQAISSPEPLSLLLRLLHLPLQVQGAALPNPFT
ncbi:hypothetical protein, partial [Stenotrophomonas hibiscicola]|uniref:hypothetical protein n=1 Tax=Stenotrophomonas hibiscicola TaxID=86189 RepID=UPI00320E6C0C